MDTLYWFSQSKLNPKVSERASDVYAQIKLTNQNTKSFRKLWVCLYIFLSVLNLIYLRGWIAMT